MNCNGCFGIIRVFETRLAESDKEFLAEDFHNKKAPPPMD
jgi:hypothetical protein